jgi:hypothetical protein
MLSGSIPRSCGRGKSRQRHCAFGNSGNGKPLAAGSYNVSWTGSDAAVQVTFKQNKKVIAEAPAKLVDGDSVSARNMLLLNEGGSLKELRLAGKKSVLKFN